MKQCNKCLLNKDPTEFSKNKSKKDGLNGTCKSCQSEYHRNYYSRRKDYYIEKGKRSKSEYRDQFSEFMRDKFCVDCGISDRRVLEFDHLPEFTKEFNIADKAGTISLKTLMKEIEKCEIVCANCHKIRTAERAGYYNYK